MPVNGTIFDSLQDGGLWNEDDVGYNFKHVLDVSTNQAFASAGKHYQIRFLLTPVTGQEIIVRFRVNAI